MESIVENKIDFCKLVQSIVLPHVAECKECMQLVNKLTAQRAGLVKSEKKSEASRLNGKLGGRPRNKQVGNTNDPPSKNE
jgi:hypothetical protein